ncbi:MAG: ATP-binding cassette domain-containing protein [Lachnospiraceae bacterium]|nr:ATP-binding cassette domain-containing protein [Lachnospiraceae bacterium]
MKGTTEPGAGGKSLLCARDVSKQYQNKTVVDHISLQLGKGVYGLLGANGAGKTTLMRMLCGILRPTQGQITLAGKPVTGEEYRAMLGYLPQDFGYYPDFTGKEFLLYMAALKGMPKPWANQKSRELLEVVGLAEQADKKIKTYSGGMKQRLGIAQALLNDPLLLVLDEPTAGLDPKERVRFRELIAQAGQSSIVLLSTHIVSDVEHIADSILMMKAGRLIYQGKWEENKGDLEAFYLEQFGEEMGKSPAAGRKKQKEAQPGGGRQK